MATLKIYNSTTQQWEYITGISIPDYTHTSNTTVSTSSATITFDSGKRISQMITISDDLDLSIECNNDADNILWIANSSSANVTVDIVDVEYNNTTVSSPRIAGGSSEIEIAAGAIAEIDVICNTDGAFITFKNNL